MFIGASTEDSFPSFQGMKPLQHIRKNNGIQMSNMGICIKVSMGLYCMVVVGYYTCIDVKDWSCDIVGLLSWRGIGKVSM